MLAICFKSVSLPRTAVQVLLAALACMAEAVPTPVALAAAAASGSATSEEDSLWARLLLPAAILQVGECRMLFVCPDCSGVHRETSNHTGKPSNKWSWFDDQSTSLICCDLASVLRAGPGGLV